MFPKISLRRIGEDDAFLLPNEATYESHRGSGSHGFASFKTTYSRDSTLSASEDVFKVENEILGKNSLFFAYQHRYPL